MTDNVQVTTAADNTMAAGTTTQVNSLWANQAIGEATPGSGTELQIMSGGLSMGGFTVSVDKLDFNAQEALIFNNNNASNISSVIQNTNGLGLTLFGGNNNLTLSGTGSNTYTGTTRVQDGTLILNKIGTAQTATTNTSVAVPGNIFVDLYGTLSNSASNQIASTSNVTVSGTWNLNNQTESVASLTINNTSGTYGLDRNGGTVNTGNGGGANSLTVGSLAINGGGTLNVQGTNGNNANNFLTVTGSGVTTMTSQTIDGFNYIAFMNVQNNNAFNTGTGGLNLTGGQIQTNGSTNSVINLNGPVTTNASPFQSYLGGINNNDNSGRIAMGGNNIVFTVADGPAVDDLIIDGQLTGTNGFTKTGPGQMHLMSPGTASTYTGDTTILNGTLLADYAIPNGTIQMGGASQAGNSTFYMNGGYTLTVPINVSARRNGIRFHWHAEPEPCALSGHRHGGQEHQPAQHGYGQYAGIRQLRRFQRIGQHHQAGAGQH